MQIKQGKGFGLALVACMAATLITGCSNQSDDDYVTKAQQRCQGKNYDDIVCILESGKTTKRMTDLAELIGLYDPVWVLDADGSSLTKGIAAITGYGPYCAVIFRKVATNDYSFGITNRHIADGRNPITTVESASTLDARKAIVDIRDFCQNGPVQKGGVITTPSPTLRPV